MTDSMLNLGMGQPAPIIRAGAALIRPGERVEFGENTPYSWVENQLYPPGTGGALPPQDMAMLMKEFPVEVHFNLLPSERFPNPVRGNDVPSRPII